MKAAKIAALAHTFPTIAAFAAWARAPWYA